MKYAPLFLLVLLATGVASCDSTKPANPLTERESVALLREVFLLLDESDEDEGSSTVECSVGGEATLTLRIIDEGESGDSAWAEGHATIAPTDCEVDIVGDTLTLNGEPNVEYTVAYWLVFDDDFEVVRGEFRAVFGGAVTWRRRNGDTDTCSVDLTLESTEFDEYEGVVGDFRGRLLRPRRSNQRYGVVRASTRCHCGGTTSNEAHTIPHRSEKSDMTAPRCRATRSTLLAATDLSDVRRGQPLGGNWSLEADCETN